MKKSGKEIYEDGFYTMAINKIKESGYDFLEGFYYYLISNKTYVTAWNYTYRVIKFFEEENINNPKSLKVENYVRYMAKLKSYSSSTKITSYAALKKLSTYLKINNICSDDYMAYIERPKPVETQEQIEKREGGFLTKQQCVDAFKSIEDAPNMLPWEKIRDKAILSVFLNTGIRRSALYKLDLADINFEDNSIKVLEKGEIYKKVYCSPSTMETIKQWIISREKLLGADNSALFISRRGLRMSKEGISGCVVRYTGKTPHKLRGTYVTELYNTTHDLFLTQQCVGHKSPRTTELYIRGNKTENARKAAEIMGNFIAN